MLSTASIASSFARPLDRLSSVLPLASIFHPAPLFLSVLGQLAIHASCMIYATKLAKAHMGDEAIAAAVAFARKADKLAEAGDEEAASSHKPNLLNTMVFLVETAQQVAVMLVNYKGRPWMKGVTENPASSTRSPGCVAGVTAAAWEIVPQLNEYLGLVPLPDDATRYTLPGLIAATLVGSPVWDRLCVLIFAPRIFKSQVDEIAALSIGDFEAQLGQVPRGGDRRRRVALLHGGQHAALRDGVHALPSDADAAAGGTGRGAAGAVSSRSHP